MTSMVVEGIITLYQNLLYIVLLQIILAFSGFFDFTAARADFIFTISQKAFKP